MGSESQQRGSVRFIEASKSTLFKGRDPLGLLGRHVTFTIGRFRDSPIDSSCLVEG